jgi:hypothetical protein
MRLRAFVGLVGAALVAGGCGGAGTSDRAQDEAGIETATTDSATPRETSSTLALKSQLSPGTRRGANLPGSQMVFNGMLFRPKGGSAIGRSQGACTRTAAGRGEVYQCLLSFVLRDGVIYGQSMASADGPAGGVVTGGTERYRNARGTFRFKTTGTPRVDLAFKLRS